MGTLSKTPYNNQVFVAKTTFKCLAVKLSYCA